MQLHRLEAMGIRTLSKRTFNARHRMRFRWRIWNVLFIPLYYVKGYHVNIALQCFKSSNFSLAWEQISSFVFIKSFSFRHKKRKISDKNLIEETENAELYVLASWKSPFGDLDSICVALNFNVFVRVALHVQEKNFISKSIHCNNRRMKIDRKESISHRSPFSSGHFLKISSSSV